MDELLSPDVKKLIDTLELASRDRRAALLQARQARKQAIRAGQRPEFLGLVTDKSWEPAAIPADLLRRQVELTGPTDRKTLINGLNSGADVYMADFEDSSSPTWSNCLQGQRNLIDAVRGNMEYINPQTGKVYRLGPQPATLIVRPRGWHLDEAHYLVAGHPVSAAIFDFAVFMAHNARELLARGTGPYFYLPKMESWQEAELWADVIRLAEDQLELPRGTVKVTVLIETISAAFEMDEIIYALRDYIVGMNCGRWDYIFSFIKQYGQLAEFVFPDRHQITMQVDFLKAYVTLLIQTCHRRGIYAMGGMAAQIPIKQDPTANEQAIEKVYQDKLREVLAGHDGTWVAHPDLIPVARKAFMQHMAGLNQLDKIPVQDILAADLIKLPKGEITLAGVRNNVYVGLYYLSVWLSGNGCVAINWLMEDAATAEICRAQLWQIQHFNLPIQGETQPAAQLIQRLLDEEAEHVQQQTGLSAPFVADAKRIFSAMIDQVALDDFLTIPAYVQLLKYEHQGLIE